MSWYTGREREIAGYDEFRLGPNVCFRCRKSFWMPRVIWHGVETIALHPKCATLLCQHLLKDALLAEKKANHPDYIVDPRQWNEVLSLRKEVEHWKEQALFGSSARKVAP